MPPKSLAERCRDFHYGISHRHPDSRQVRVAFGATLTAARASTLFPIEAASLGSIELELLRLYCLESTADFFEPEA